MPATNVVLDVGGSPPSADEKLRIVDEVLRSESFARSERLKSLLRFLCEAEIEGREADLTEYTIGTMALGRPADFSPLEDSSVRSRAHELRQRLEKYYAVEAPAAPVRIELRKGSYIPRFCLVPREDEAEVTAPASSISEEAAALPEKAAALPEKAAARVHIPLRSVAVGFAAGAVAMFVGLAAWSGTARPGAHLPATRLEASAAPSPWTPELEAIWAPFLGKRAPVLVAFETRFFVQMGPLVTRDPHVDNIGEVESSDSLMRVKGLFGLHQLYSNLNYSDVGAPLATFYLARLLSSRIPGMVVKSSHEMTAADFRDNNLILIGKPWMDPRVERVLAKADLVDVRGKVLNVHPKPGEPAEYLDANDQVDPEGWSEKYSVITMLPNPAGKNRILALAATGSEASAALAYFLTSPETARELWKHLHTGSTVPEYYQILVRAEFKSTALVKVEYVTYRTLVQG